MPDTVMRGLANKSKPLMGRKSRRGGSVLGIRVENDVQEGYEWRQFWSEACPSDIMDQKGEMNIGTLLTFGEPRRDQCLVRGVSNPITNRPHINFVIRGLWNEGKENVPAGSKSLI